MKYVISYVIVFTTSLLILRALLLLSYYFSSYFLAFLLVVYLCLWWFWRGWGFSVNSQCRENLAVLITGCDSGLGLALALELDRKGLVVVATCLEEEAAREVMKKMSGRSVGLVMDVRKEKSIERCKEEVEIILEKRRIEGLYAVVNNAGIWSFGLMMRKEEEEMKERKEGESRKGRGEEEMERRRFRERKEEAKKKEEEEWNEVWKTNIIGVIRVSRAFLPLIRKYVKRSDSERDYRSSYDDDNRSDINENRDDISNLIAASSHSRDDSSDYNQTILFILFELISFFLPFLSSLFSCPFLSFPPPRIIVVSSVLGEVGLFGQAVYCASKFALRGIAEAWSQELHILGIRCILVVPAATSSTKLFDRFLGTYTPFSFPPAVPPSMVDSPEYHLLRHRLLFFRKFSGSLASVVKVLSHCVLCQKPKFEYHAGWDKVAWKLFVQLDERLKRQVLLQMFALPFPWEKSFGHRGGGVECREMKR